MHLKQMTMHNVQAAGRFSQLDLQWVKEKSKKGKVRVECSHVYDKTQVFHNPPERKANWQLTGS